MNYENRFVQYLGHRYSHNELADMANHGANTGHSGLIWTRDLINLFDEYGTELFEIMADYADVVGGEALPDYVRKNGNSYDGFIGAVVYFCAEYVAYQLTGGEYQRNEETEDA